MSWYNNPGRHCVGNIGYAEADRRKKRDTERMMYACLTCPVLAACHADALDNPWKSGTIQGGIRW